MCWDLRVPEIDDLLRGELIALTRRLFVEVQDLTRVNAELVTANAALSDRVARLERLVTRNSRNSGTPPSKDDDLGRTPPADELDAGRGELPRKRGKLKGRAGVAAGLVRGSERDPGPLPAGVCGCGSDLADAADVGVYAAHQQVDVPLVTATVTQHDRHAVRCGCGKVHVSARPEHAADAAVSFGPNLVSWCVYLMVAHCDPGRTVR